MKYEQKSFAVPQQTSTIFGCERCIYGSGEHLPHCPELWKRLWALENELGDDRARLRHIALKTGLLCQSDFWLDGFSFKSHAAAQEYIEWLLDLKALVVELAEIPQKDGE